MFIVFIYIYIYILMTSSGIFQNQMNRDKYMIPIVKILQTKKIFNMAKKSSIMESLLIFSF